MLTAKSLTYVLPDGSTLFNNLNLTLEKKKYGLVGANGAGKTTLLRLLAQEIEPAQGRIVGKIKVFCVNQFEAMPDLTVAEYLLDIWLDPFGNSLIYNDLLKNLDLSSRIATLSGGEWMRVRLAKAIGTEERVLSLDEPTNNLDRLARECLYRFLKNYQGAIIVISHDRELLQYVDEVWELSNQGLCVYGGNFSFYETAKRSEMENLEKAIDIARQEKKKQEQAYQNKLERQRKRMQWGKSNVEKLGLPRIAVGTRKRQAQSSLGRIHKDEQESLDGKEEQFGSLLKQQKRISQWRPGLEAPKKLKGKVIFSLKNFNFRFSERVDFLWKHPLNFTLYSQERLYLKGENGSGKTTLLRLLTSSFLPPGEVQGEYSGITRKYLYLDQHYSLLSPNLTVLENLQEGNRFTTEELRNKLADFGFYGNEVFKKGEILSGGERLRACLAKLILSADVPEVMILDEPSNNLDLESVSLLEKALYSYQGTLIIVTHDETLSQKINCERELNLSDKAVGNI